MIGQNVVAFGFLFSILIYPVITFDYNVYRSGTSPALIGPDEKWVSQEEKLNELAAHREEFYAVLEQWLEGVREGAFKPE